MTFDLFPWLINRQVVLCGTNIYPIPEYHVDRVLEGEHDLMYVYEGTWQVAQDDVVYNLKAGDVLLLRAGSHHWGTALCSVGSRNMFIHFNAVPGDRAQVSLSAAEARSYAQGGYFCIPTLTHCGVENTISDLFRSVVQVYWGHKDDKERRLNLLLNTILNEVSSIARNSQPEAEAWIVNILHVISDEPSRQLSLAEAAEMAQMNERTFSARFRKMMGRSFHEYQIAQKLDMAYDALRSGRYTVKEVALEYGFNDPYYFSRLFSVKFGVAPSEIRRGEPSANVNRPNMR